MALPESRYSAPDITPVLRWEDGDLWGSEDILVHDINPVRLPPKKPKLKGEPDPHGDFTEATIGFNSYGKQVVEADLSLQDSQAGKIATIGGLVHSHEEQPTAALEEELQTATAFKTIFFGLQLDKNLKSIDVVTSDVPGMEAVMRSGVPEGWRRLLVNDATDESTDSWQQAWQWMLEGKEVTINFSKVPDLNVVTGGVALRSTAEVQNVTEAV